MKRMEGDRVRTARFAEAHQAMGDTSARARRDAVITLSALGGADAYEPLLLALRDPDKKGRFNGMLGLTMHDESHAHADAVVAALASHGSGARGCRCASGRRPAGWSRSLDPARVRRTASA